ncbi:NIPSNAP family protein [Streptomyces sp. NPDC058375]|uniref:NIPSNAP family protein n=1 Tax=Streptomyces sp. NPDC058375 TaxID=3346467 RepID=UPI003652D801
MNPEALAKNRSSVVELRQYTLHPGARDTLIELFERQFVTGQEEAGIRVGGRFRDLDDPDRFVWLRSFPDMAERARALHAFYCGPVWRAHRDAATATMVDSDDVLLLRGPAVPVPTVSGPAGAGTVVATICHPLDPAAFADHVERRLRPELPAGAVPQQVLRTEHAENTFPALPVRTGEDVVVWFTPGEPAPLPDLAQHLSRPPQRLRLLPTVPRVCTVPRV